MQSYVKKKLNPEFEEKKSDITSLPDEKRLSSQSLQYIYMHTVILLSRIQRHNQYDAVKKGYFYDQENDENELEYIQREKQKNHVIELLKTFNSHFAASSSVQLSANILIKANQDLQQLIPALIDFISYCPLIKPVMLTHRAQFAENTKLEEKSILNQKILIDLNKYTKELLKEVTENARSQERQWLQPYYPVIIDALKSFNSWFTPQAIHLHAFELRALNATEIHWHYLLQVIQEPVYFRDLQVCHSTLRPLISLYHYHVEERLKQLRAAASKQQVERTTLYQQLAGLEEKADNQASMNQARDTNLQQQIEEIENQEKTSQESAYKNALRRITAICRNDQALVESKKRPPPEAIKIITQLSDIRNIKKPVPSVPPTISMINSQERKEHKNDIAKYPVMITYLLDLKNLRDLNENTRQLLQALQASSFWYPSKKDYCAQLIEWIRDFNACFIDKNLSDEIVIEKSNICLRNLILGIRHSPSLSDFEDEYQNDIGKLLQAFLSCYGQTISNELPATYATYRDMRTSSIQLKQEIVLLKEQLNNDEKKLETKLITSPEVEKEFKLKTHKNNSYREALLEIASVIFCAKEIESSPQLVPMLMNILERSYDALTKTEDEVTKEKKHSALSREYLTCPVAPCSTTVDELPPIIEDKSTLTEKLPWKSLSFIYQWSQVLLNKYSNYYPENNRTIGFGGFTDRLAGYTDRQVQYSNFCNTMRQQLEAFNKKFTLITSDPVAENVIEEINAALQQIINQIAESITGDRLSNTFCKIYQYEKNRLTSKKMDLRFLNWVHLKKLNTASQQALLEIQTWQDIYFGYLTQAPLLLGAVQYFNRQFLSETIFENTNNILGANEALLFLMRMIDKDQECIALSLSHSRLLSFIIKCNRYVEETIIQLSISVKRKEFDNQILKNKIRDLEKSKTINRDQDRLQAILQKRLNTRPACINALRKVIDSEPKVSITSAFKGIFVSAKIKLSEIEKKIPATKVLGEEKEVKIVSAVQEDAPSSKKTIEAIPLLTCEFLNLLQDEATKLLRELSRPPSFMQSLMQSAKIKKEISNIIVSLENFQQCFKSSASEEQANNCLQELIRNVSYCPDLNDFEKEIRWSLQSFLSHYRRVITQYLQHLCEIDRQYSLESKRLTAQIDQLNHQKNMRQLPLQPTLYFKPLIQQALAKERAKNKPAEQAVREIAKMIFSLEKSEIDVRIFPILITILQPIFTVFRQSNDVKEDAFKTYSLRFS